MNRKSEKTEATANPVGTTPAIRANLTETILIALSGVPAETHPEEEKENRRKEYLKRWLSKKK